MQRISMQNMSFQYLTDLNRALAKQNKLQEQMSTGRKINRASDDPIGISRSIALRNSYSKNSRYLANAKQAQSLMQTADSALQDISSALIKAKELIVEAANGTNTPEDRKTFGIELEQILDTIVAAGNTDVGGRYLFAGQDDGQQPFIRAANGEVSFVGDNNPVSIRLQSGGIVPNQDAINVTCAEAFGPNLELFTDINNIAKSLKDGSATDVWLSNTALGQIDSAHYRVLQADTALGARMASYQMTTNLLEEKDTTIQQDISDVEDIDLAKVISEYQLWTTVYDATLKVGSKVLPMTLANFI